MKKKLFTLTLLSVLAVLPMSVNANDGVFFTHGNFLVPTRETDISVKKEILTITIGRDSMATVDVYYEFINNGDAKTVTMAFEADAPYNACAKVCKNGVHPNIRNFTVNMNDQPLSYDNKIIAVQYENGSRQVDFTPLDLTKWKGNGEVADSLLPMDDALYNAEQDSVVSFAYGYFFTAPFKSGLNIVHHTYSFLMSYRVGEKFIIPYWLTPATRWANHQVDDFTLRIKSERLRDFCMADSVFAGAPFKVVSGVGDVYQTKISSGESFILASIGDDATLEWHKTNYCPKADMEIEDAERVLNTFSNSANVVIDAEGTEYKYVGDSGDTYLVLAQDYCQLPKKGCKIVEYSVDKGQGWIYPKDPGTYNVRQAPSSKSPVIGRIKYEEGMLPDTYRCLGQSQTKDKNDWGWWYKIRFGKRIGYVYGSYMQWDAIVTF